MKLNSIRRETGLSRIALLALLAAFAFSTSQARAEADVVTSDESAIVADDASDSIEAGTLEWNDETVVADGDQEGVLHDRGYHPRPAPRPYPRPYPRPAPHPRPYPRPAPHPRPYPRPIPRWPVPPYVPPYATPYLYTCYAENARGELFDSRAYNPNVAQDEAIDECYEWGSAECYAIGCN